MTTPILIANSGDDRTLYTMMIGAPVKGESLLSKLSDEQRQALDEWTTAQPLRDGIVDLMEWPGWAEVIMSIMSKVEKALSECDETNKPVIFDEYHKFGPDPAVADSRKLYQEFCAERESRNKSAK